MRPNSVLVGLLSPQVLSIVENDPNCIVAQELQSCDCVEIRYDLFPEEQWSELAARTRRVHPNALRLATIRLQRDGGNFSNEQATMRLPLWGEILEAPVGVHWLDLELECARDYTALAALAQASHARILLSQHHFDGIPLEGELVSFAQQCRRLGAPGFKIACMSHSLGDTAGLYAFTRKQANHFELFSAFAMGATGQASRIYSLACGANVTYGAIGEVLAPGQIQVKTMRRLMDALSQCSDEAAVTRLLESLA
jgi:3-dehydroquinate dehydratase I